MNKLHHIEKLEREIEKIKNAPVKHFLGKIGKAWRIDRLQRKIRDLKKNFKVPGK